MAAENLCAHLNIGWILRSNTIFAARPERTNWPAELPGLSLERCV
ncbi:hypothetical protein [Glutamicibacter sp. NPDC087344]